MPEQHLLRVHRGSLLLEAGKRCLAARKPAHGALAGIFCIMIFSRVFHAFVKGHGNRAAKVGLNAHAFLWTHKNAMTIQMRGKGDPFLCDFPQLRQAEHLKPAGIGKDRPVPSGKAVQAAQFGHIFIARPQVQMIGVAQHHLTMVGLQIKCGQAAFDGACPVATFMKAGVCTVPCTVSKLARLALSSVFIRRYISFTLLP